MDTQRLIALIVFSFSGFMLWEAWQKHTHPPVAPIAPVASADARNATLPVPSSISAPSSTAAATQPIAAAASVDAGKRVSVRTDFLAVELSASGGDIRSVALLKQSAHGDKNRPFVLMQDKPGAFFVTQSGLLGKDLPTHQSAWKVDGEKFDLGGGEKLEVAFSNSDTAGLQVRKIYTFTRSSYVVDLRYEIKNELGETIAPNAYFQFLRDGNPPEGESSGGNMFTGGVVTFVGPAVYTEEKKYQKISFGDIDKDKKEYPKEANDGWVALVQHYFVSAWLPGKEGHREFFTRKVAEKMYTAGLILPTSPIGPGASGAVHTQLYLGPQEQEKLKLLAPGLDLVVDYGWLKVLAYPMFEVLSWINKIIGNWGWTIILFTILIKAVFFPLNQKAGKSMAQMKTLAPKMEALKARYGDDKMKLNQAMMDLYRTEKINPMGGCLPILVQMPFFIALYWVLLGAVELRNAPWIGWITDLSTPDPFYVLPVVMGISMIVQTKLNPAPPDPVQAKVMMAMPVIFSIMFLFFPAGLVLYWTMQNILGIAQQWYINKSLESNTSAKPGKR
jgi:YidC/Oxa1 family membrane protein insertase